VWIRRTVRQTSSLFIGVLSGSYLDFVRSCKPDASNNVRRAA